MTTSRGGGIVGQLGRIFERGTLAGLTEAQVLERYAVHRDGAAFEALIARHGSTVLGVCRRFLRDPNDVDDAFQATFIILARKAAGLRNREALGPWLHGVACRVASRARADAARRRRRESADERAVALIPADSLSRPDLGWVIDEEILRLPAKLRLPVVLCLMEGRTYDEAAVQLQWTVGMVRGRLAAGRVRLRDRLIRRGEAHLAAPASIATGDLVVASGLVESTSRIAVDVIFGKGVASSAVILANRTMGGWLMVKFTTAALVLVLAGVAFAAGSTGLRLLDRGRGEMNAPIVNTDEPPLNRATGPVVAPGPTSKRRRGGLEFEVHPITVGGRALDRDGRPVAGASIVVTDANRLNFGDTILGRSTSGADGRFVLRDLPLPVLPPDPGPIPKPAEGKFEVAGSAPGLAFTWHPVQSYRPTPPPADAPEAQSGQVSFAGQPIVADLVFGPPARVRGRIMDDAGKPMAGVLVQFGYINSTSTPDRSGSWNCTAINPGGGDELEFNGIGSLPEDVRSTRTDADGRYEINSLPREVKLLTLIDPDPAMEPYSAAIATSSGAFPGIASLGHDGTFDHVFVLPRSVRVRVTRADSGRPAPGVTVLAQGNRSQRAGAIGTTDPEGRTTLSLPPGEYALRAEPPIGLPYRLAAGRVDVPAAPPESAVDLTLEPGAIVVLEAVDAASGRGLADIGFEFVPDNSADRQEVHSQTAFVDHPRTDDSGQVRVVMNPGRGHFVVGRTPFQFDHEPVAPTGPILTLGPGATTVARFSFRQRAEGASPTDDPVADEVGRRLLRIWRDQAHKISRGRARVTRTDQAGGSIPPDQFRDLLGSLDPDQVPALIEQIRRTWPDAEPAATSGMDLVSDGSRRREEETMRPRQSKPTAPQVLVANGRETVRFSPVNAQVDIGDDGQKSGLRWWVAGLGEFASWPSWTGKVIRRDHGRVTLEQKFGESVARIVADEATGFVYRTSMGRTDGSSGEDHWQFAPRVTAHGAIIPGLSVEHSYQKESTSFIQIRTIESIDLDAPIPPATFLVAIPTGVQILDYREGRDDTYRGVTRRPVTDVVAYADADPRRFRPFVPPIKVGDLAPAIDPLIWLDPVNNAPFPDLAVPDLAGKVVLIDFWGIDCGFCIAQMPAVREAAEHFATKGLVLIGLHDSSGKPGNVLDFASKRGLTWPLAIDRPGEGFGATFAAYGVRSIPHAAVLDRQGRLAFIGRFPEALAKAADLLKSQ